MGKGSSESMDSNTVLDELGNEKCGVPDSEEFTENEEKLNDKGPQRVLQDPQ